MLIVLLKELAESCLRSVRRLTFRKTSLNTKTIIKEIQDVGVSIQPSFFTKEECGELRQKIDNMIESSGTNVWVDDEGSDKRVYFANELDFNIERFYQNKNIRDILSAYTGTNKPNGMVLAAKVTHTENNIGSGGGWHRDSPVSHQFKAICYLSDVQSSNGPFQYIKGSHKKSNVLINYLKGILDPGVFRFSEKQICNYLNKNENSIDEVTGDAGSLVFADTKIIHRGKPLDSGERYALFCYFWHGEIPEHFAKLKQ